MSQETMLQQQYVDDYSLMIVEASTVTTKDLIVSKDNKGYVLEGIFGEIGVKNKNNRIYDEEEYIPQIESLQDKISKRKLLGELDHPKQFEVSLSNASHVIEKLEYDKATKQVKGRIRLLNTSKGKEAQALIDAGIPLHISSRAAGSVKENGHVQIKKLFTYDLVADPGFANAELRTVNESFGFTNDGNLFIYEMNSFTNSDADNDKYNDNNTTKNIAPTMEDTTVKAEDFNQYSHYVKDEISRLEELISNITKSSTSEGVSNEVLDKILEQYNEIKEAQDKIIRHNNTIVDEVNNLKEYTLYLAEETDKGIEYTKHVAEVADSGIEYTKHVAEKADRGIEYSESIAESVEDVIAYANMISEKLGTSIDYSNENASKLDEAIQYIKYIANNVDENTDNVLGLIDYTNLISEKTGEVIDYTEFIKEHVEFIAEGLTSETNNDSTSTTSTVNESNVEGTEATPIATVNESSYEEILSNKLNAIMESAKKQKAESENDDLHFLKFLDVTKKNEFEALSEEKQTEVISAFKNNKYFSTTEATQIFESVFAPKAQELNYLTNMPEEYKEAWNNLNESQQNAIKAQSKYYPLNTPYQINNFWSTRDLRAVKVNLETINESKVAAGGTSTQNTYSTNYMSNIEEQMKKRFKR